MIKDWAKRALWKVYKALLRVEHNIYCATDCKVELFLHRSYYERRKKQYEEYLYQQQLGVAVL